MKSKKRFLKALSTIVCFVLITAIALTFAGCQKKDPSGGASAAAASEQTVNFTFVVVDGDGNEETFQIGTTEKTVGAALLKEGLIEGEDSEYGLYVKKVNGITADYNTDGTYWAFYVGGEYATSGVDTTDAVEGETYAFKVEKG